MAIKKISQLSLLTSPHSNTANTVLLAVDYYANPDETKQIRLGTLTNQAISGWTANTIPYVNAAGFITTTTSKLQFDYANNSLGIGTSVLPTANLDVHGSAVITGNLTVVGTTQYTGNVTTVNISGTTGKYYGFSANGFNALYAGVPTGYLLEPQATFQITSDYNGYSAINMQNINSGTEASTDAFFVADNGTATEGFLDVGIASSTYDYPGYTIIEPNDSYIIAAGTSTTGGSLILGTQLDDDVIFVRGGFNPGNEAMRINSGNNLVVTGNVVSKSINLISYSNEIYAKTNTAFNFANAVNAYAYSAYAFANTINVYSYSAYSFANTTNVKAQSAYTKANNAGDIAAAAFTNSNSAFTHASSGYNVANTLIAALSSSAAFDKANSALANTSGTTFGGNLIVSGSIVTPKITSSNSVTIINSSLATGQSAIAIVGSPDGTRFTPSQNGYMLHVTGQANTPSRVIIDSFGYGGTYSLVAGRSARGTPSSPLATANGDVLMRLAGNGYGATQFAPLGTARIDFVATENYTDSAYGSAIKFYNTTEGSTTVAEIATFNANSATFTGHVIPAKGFIYTPRVLEGAQTAITIDFSRDSMVKSNCAADIAYTLTNFVAGKVVEVWLTNTSGSNRTVTHGCTALNSTVNGTTFTIPATSSACMKYFSIDGDLANTFVSVAHA